MLGTVSLGSARREGRSCETVAVIAEYAALLGDTRESTRLDLSGAQSLASSHHIEKRPAPRSVSVCGGEQRPGPGEPRRSRQHTLAHYPVWTAENHISHFVSYHTFI